MELIELKISNFRMIKDATISFKKGNYIVGKNNIGKTSTLELINIIFSDRNFNESDFKDSQNSISVDAKIHLSDDEIGSFGDNFLESANNQIILNFLQNDPDSQMIITSTTTDSSISRKQIAHANYIGFSSNRRPIRENDLTQQSGNYRFIPFLAKNFLASKDTNIKNDTSVDQDVINYINKRLLKIKPFKDNGLSVDIDSNYLDYITRALKVNVPSGVEFSKIGYGTQFSSLIPLIILDKVILWARYNHLDDHVCTTNTKEKELNIILGLDEPEVHLHPNLQSTTISDIKSLLKGNDNDFNELLKELFNIDKIKGQLIIVTHSPYVLSNDYHEYIRYSTDHETLKITSGSSISLEEKEIKQLESQLPYVKSDLFADSVVLVEGQTEAGAMPVFAKRMGIDLIRDNINIVNANGVESIPALQKLFQKLDINNIAVVDNDHRSRNFERTEVTDKLDFEDECINYMDLKNINHYLRDFSEYIKQKRYTGAFWENIFNENFLIQEKKVLRNPQGDVCKFIDQYIDTIDKNSLSKNQKNKFIKDYLKDKSVINGRIIAKNIEKIPDVYKRTLKKAQNFK